MITRVNAIREGGARDYEGDKGVLPLGEMSLDIVKDDNNNNKTISATINNR